MAKRAGSSESCLPLKRVRIEDAGTPSRHCTRSPSLAKRRLRLQQLPKLLKAPLTINADKAPPLLSYVGAASSLKVCFQLLTSILRALLQDIQATDRMTYIAPIAKAEIRK